MVTKPGAVRNNSEREALMKCPTCGQIIRTEREFCALCGTPLKKKSYTLKKGRTAKIKPRLVLVDKKKKALSKKHGPRFRYASSNKKVATVTKGGKIRARKAGKCTVYVYAINGCTRKIRVNVR